MLGQEHNHHLGQQAHLRPAGGDPHPPQWYRAPGGRLWEACGREEVLSPWGTNSWPLAQWSARERGGVRGRGETSLLGNLAPAGGIEYLLPQRLQGLVHPLGHFVCRPADQRIFETQAQESPGSSDLSGNNSVVSKNSLECQDLKISEQPVPLPFYRWIN